MFLFNALMSAGGRTSEVNYTQCKLLLSVGEPLRVPTAECWASSFKRWGGRWEWASHAWM